MRFELFIALRYLLARRKQDSATRHIQVQVVTVKEERLHSIERGAFSYLAKPANTDDVNALLSADQYQAKAGA